MAKTSSVMGPEKFSLPVRVAAIVALATLAFTLFGLFIFWTLTGLVYVATQLSH